MDVQGEEPDAPRVGPRCQTAPIEASGLSWCGSIPPLHLGATVECFDLQGHLQRAYASKLMRNASRRRSGARLSRRQNCGNCLGLGVLAGLFALVSVGRSLREPLVLFGYPEDGFSGFGVNQSGRHRAYFLGTQVPVRWIVEERRHGFIIAKQKVTLRPIRRTK